MQLLTGGSVTRISIFGGEPLIHPDLLEILQATRESFVNTIIQLTTNGLLLLNQNNDFWNICKDCDINIVVTKYPINLDYDNIIKSVEGRGIAFKFHSYTGKATKTLYKMPLDLKGQQDVDKSFTNCTLANRWIALMDGRMYTCQVAPNAFHFNKKFGANLDLLDGDFLDIYKVKDVDEILSFLSSPKPFCKYCKTTEIVNGIPWQPSKKDIEEWT